MTQWTLIAEHSHALDAAMTILFHTNAHWRRASDVHRYAPRHGYPG